MTIQFQFYSRFRQWRLDVAEDHTVILQQHPLQTSKRRIKLQQTQHLEQKIIHMDIQLLYNGDGHNRHSTTTKRIQTKKKSWKKKQYNKKKVNVQIRSDSPQSGQGHVQV